MKISLFYKPLQTATLLLICLLLVLSGEAQTTNCPTWYSRTNIAYRVDSLFPQRQACDTGNNQNPTSITTFKTTIAGQLTEYTFYAYIEKTINDKSVLRVRRINYSNKSYKGATVDTIQLPRSDGNYHVCPTIGIDSVGYIHVTADMHNGYWRYFRSKMPLDPASGFDTLSKKLNLLAVGITYPTIFYDNKKGMYILFRHRNRAGKGNGNHRIGIIKYNHNVDTTKATFTMLGGVNYNEKNSCNPSQTTTMGWANGYGGNGYFDNDGNYIDGWYIKPGHRIYFDASNRMHFIATVISDLNLKEGVNPIQYNKDILRGGFESNTHILYAYSDDYGKNWYKAGGAKIATLPLTPTNASIALKRVAEHDIIGGECELGALDKNTPLITYKLYSDNTYHAIKWNGNAWEEFCLPIKTNVFMCRNVIKTINNVKDTTGYAAWYNGYTFAYTKDCQNWVVTSEANAQQANEDSNFTGKQSLTNYSFPDGLKDISATGIDREYFKQTGNFRYQGTYNTYTLHNIYTIYAYVGDTIRDKSITTLKQQGVSVTQKNTITKQNTSNTDNVANSCLVYPNPLNNTANLIIRLISTIKGQTYQIQISNSLGQVVYNKTITTENAGYLNHTINNNLFSKGFYGINVSFKGQSIYTSKLVVQ